ncbi:MAG: hypothetical protein U0641_12550 [Anaerolineae bacterium]
MRRTRWLLLAPALLALLACVALLGGAGFSSQAEAGRPLLTATLSPTPTTPTPGNRLFLPLVLRARVSSSTAVTGAVVLQDGACCAGGIANQPLNIHAAFTAASTVGVVTSMRVVAAWCPLAAQLIPGEPWQPFVNSMTYTITPPINWSSFDLAAQFQDNHGNVSPIYCADIAVEGMPPLPATATPTPTATQTPILDPLPPTHTATPTATPTETPILDPLPPTHTATWTPNSTDTPTATPTPTSTTTQTRAPASTNTPTSAPTAIPTFTRTPSRTPTPVRTATLTPIPTAIPTIRVCCRYCTPGVSKPCGDSCIPWSNTCHQPPGCACSASIGAGDNAGACGQEDLGSAPPPNWLARLDPSNGQASHLAIRLGRLALD